MKKKVLVFSHALEIGGAERALLGLLETIDTTKYYVDLFLERHQGELMSYIPDKINLLPESKKYSCMATPIVNVIKNRQFKIALARYKGKKAAKKRIKELNFGDCDVALEYSQKFSVKYMPPISDKEYDIAISFLTPHYFVAQKVKAKKKIAWIHTDYSVVQVDKESQYKMWDPYDYIASISDQAAEEFKKAFPQLSEKVFTMENIMPMRYMDELINEFSVDEEMLVENCINLLSIGRFCTAKNFDTVPEICRKLIEKGFNVKWYLIGFGGTEKLVREKIFEFEMSENVVILGKKSNPYPYIKACDIYVQPSRYEGKCVTVREAQILNKPVIITNYATSSSQLKDGFDGVIVPMDNEGCAEGIAKVIRDKSLQETLIENTKKTDYTNKSEINKLYEIIDN